MFGQHETGHADDGEAVYEMTCAVVEVGGEGVHEDYHLILNERSELSSVWAQFPSLPLRLKMLS